MDQRPRRACRFLPEPIRQGARRPDHFVGNRHSNWEERARTYGHFVGEGPRNSCEKAAALRLRATPPHSPPPGFGARTAAFNSRRKIVRERKKKPKDAANKRGGGRRDETPWKRKRKRGREDEEGGAEAKRRGGRQGSCLTITASASRCRRCFVVARCPSAAVAVAVAPECGGWWPGAVVTAHSRPARLAPVCRQITPFDPMPSC